MVDLHHETAPIKEPTMPTEISLPVAVAYFTVRIPADRTTVTLAAEAERVVERYLYNGSVVDVDLDLDMDDLEHPAYVVMVRIENWKSVADLTSRVQIQRDRFSSGLYSSTEPKILTDPNYHAATA